MRRACALCKAILFRGELPVRDEIPLKFVASKGNSIDEDEEEVSAEIGAVAPLSDTLRMSGGLG